MSIHIPIFEEFEKEQERWGNILNYMAYYCKRSAPLLEDEDRDTFYLPLVANNHGQPPALVMIDIRKLKFASGATPHFVAIKNTIGLPTDLFKWSEKMEKLCGLSER